MKGVKSIKKHRGKGEQIKKNRKVKIATDVGTSIKLGSVQHMKRHAVHATSKVILQRCVVHRATQEQFSRTRAVLECL